MISILLKRQYVAKQSPFLIKMPPLCPAADPVETVEFFVFGRTCGIRLLNSSYQIQLDVCACVLACVVECST